VSKVALDAMHLGAKARQWDENPVFREPSIAPLPAKDAGFGHERPPSPTP